MTSHQGWLHYCHHRHLGGPELPEKQPSKLKCIVITDTGGVIPNSSGAIPEK
jgi:hypothetical protein